MNSSQMVLALGEKLLSQMAQRRLLLLLFGEPLPRRLITQRFIYVLVYLQYNFTDAVAGAVEDPRSYGFVDGGK